MGQFALVGAGIILTAVVLNIILGNAAEREKTEMNS